MAEPNPKFPITDPAQLLLLDAEEMREGYYDGRKGEPEPRINGNRSVSYIHGWWNGATDGGHKEIPGWMRILVHRVATECDFFSTRH